MTTYIHGKTETWKFPNEQVALRLYPVIKQHRREVGIDNVHYYHPRHKKQLGWHSIKKWKPGNEGQNMLELNI